MKISKLVVVLALYLQTQIYCNPNFLYFLSNIVGMPPYNSSDQLRCTKTSQ